jgi:retinol dehydrogenase-12
MVLMNMLLHTPIHGAYTELFAGLSPDVTMEKNGAWSEHMKTYFGIFTNHSLVAPWGRFVSLRKDIEGAAKSKEEGGTGIASQFWNWTEEQVKPFA